MSRTGRGCALCGPSVPVSGTAPAVPNLATIRLPSGATIPVAAPPYGSGARLAGRAAVGSVPVTVKFCQVTPESVLRRIAVPPVGFADRTRYTVDPSRPGFSA